MSLTRSIVMGTAWTVGMRWFIRGLGLISIAILARLLDPADFGLVTMALAIAALSEVLLNFGVDTAIIRNQDATDRHFDTAWTIRIIQGIGIASTVLLMAQPAASFYDDQRVAGLLYVAAATIALQGFENIGVVLLRRDLDFRRDFIFNAVNRICGVTGTIVLAYSLRSYWALILGPMIQAAVGVGFSYFISPYRPRFSLAEWTEIWLFSKWNLIKGVADYAFRQLDKVFLGRFIGPYETGIYNVSGELSTLATGELIGPLNRVLVPGLSRLNKDPERLRDAFLRAQNSVVAVALPASVGIGLTATELVPLILGPKWTAAIPLVQLFAIMAAAQATMSTMGNLLTISGHIRLAAALVWVQSLTFITLIYPGYLVYGVAGIVVAKGIAAIASVLVAAGMNAWANGIRIAALAGALARPIIATLIMGTVLIWLDDMLTLVAWAMLTAKVVTGALVYVFALAASWHWSGRPNGLEALCVEWLSAQYVKRRPGL